MEREELRKKVRVLSTSEDLLALLNELKAEMAGDNVVPLTADRLRKLGMPEYEHKCYYEFCIPKKSGGVRVISAPRGNLAWVQSALNEMFKAVYTPALCVTGFAEGRSVADNAREHVGRFYVFNVDLRDFFTSITRRMLHRRLIKAPFSFTKEVANMVVDLCTVRKFFTGDDEFFLFGNDVEYRDVLPQGAPTSPILSNAVCDELDRKLSGLCENFCLSYTRYADDLTFSGYYNAFRDGSRFVKKMTRIINSCGLHINERKTRLRHCSGRQEVTGLTVGTKVNVPREFVRDIRTILHIWERYGANDAYRALYKRKVRDGSETWFSGKPSLKRVLAGKLAYMKMVKGADDGLYLRLKARFDRLVAQSASRRERPDWEYVFTMKKTEFERIVGAPIKFSTPQDPEKRTYGTIFHGYSYGFVAISRRIDINAMPADACISLCRVKDPESEGGFRTLYFLHRAPRR